MRVCMKVDRERMDSGHCKIRMNEEDDRLSSLSDDLIHKILSFLNITDAIQTSFLSSRWRFIWTTMPYLNLSFEDLGTLPRFSKFVPHVLSRRNNSTEVYSVKLSFRGKGSHVLVKRILDYAFSHNIQQLNVIWFLVNDTEFPLSLFSSQSVKHFSLTMQRSRFSQSSVNSHLTSTWELPALTKLDLHSVILGDEEADNSIFSKCGNLKSLTVRQFDTRGSNGFSIIHPLLSNLTLENGWSSVKVVNVVAPKLENLTIRSCNHANHVMISAPHLVSLNYKGSSPLHLSTDGVHSLEKADICVPCPRKANAHEIVSLLQHLHNVHFLMLNMEIVEFLSSSVELLLHQTSPFVNLKSLKIYPDTLREWDKAPEKVIMSDELKSYLLDSSPGSTFTMILREEVKAQNIMAELRVILKKEKDDTETNPMLKFGGDMTQIKSCWENLGVQIDKVSVIISKLQDIEELLAKLPASKRAKIQPCFSSLCAEADITIGQITDSMKVQSDENQSLPSVCFQMNLLQHWRCFLSKLSLHDFSCTRK